MLGANDKQQILLEKVKNIDKQILNLLLRKLNN